MKLRMQPSNNIFPVELFEKPQKKKLVYFLCLWIITDFFLQSFAAYVYEFLGMPTVWTLYSQLCNYVCYETTYVAL